MSVADKFVGRWTFVSSENFDAYLKQVADHCFGGDGMYEITADHCFGGDGMYEITADHCFGGDGMYEITADQSVGLVTRKIASSLKPALIFSVDGDRWKIVSESTFKTLVWEFELGKEIDETTGDGRQMKSTFTLEGDKLIQIEKAIKAEDKDSRFERFIDEQGQLIITCESGGVVAKRIYKKAE